MKMPRQGREILGMRPRPRFRGNALACLAFLPLWSVSWSLSFFYLSLYFRECGVSDAQLGFLVTAGAGASIVFSFLAAPVVDRLGRRKSTLIFDISGSALPLLLYALNGSFAFALAGTILSNSGRVMNVGYYLLMTEDAGNGERAEAFNIFNIIVIASGLLVPIAGGFVARAGLVRAERWFLLISAAVITGAAFGRNRLATETATGKLLIARRAGMDRGKIPGISASFLHGMRALIEPYGIALRHIRSRRKAAAAIAANVLFYVYYLVGTNSSLYFAPFFADALGMDPALVGVVGAMFSGGTLFAMLFFNPLLFRRMGPARCGFWGAALNLAGFLPLLFLRERAGWILGSVGLAAIGYGMLKSAIDASLATSFGDARTGAGGKDGRKQGEGNEARAGVYAIANLASSILGMGAGALCSLIYPTIPRFIPALSAVILAGICLLLNLAERPAAQSARSRRAS